MKFYNVKETLYLEIDVSGVGLGARLQFQGDQAPDNRALSPITSAGKILT